MDKELLEEQWREIKNKAISDLCPHPELYANVHKMDINHFWACVLDYTNSGGVHEFRELALFALRALTVPISNAVVERLFSVMSYLKNKFRNKMQLKMLDALLRLRTHLQVNNIMYNVFRCYSSHLHC